MFSHTGSAEKGSGEGMRRFVLADFGTWREDKGVEHLASVLPFLPASDSPYLTFLPREPPTAGMVGAGQQWICGFKKWVFLWLRRRDVHFFSSSRSWVV